jgi:PAS domain S-box-containing protein
MKLRKISFKIKIILIIETIVIAASAVMSFLVWRQLEQKVREITREKLVAIASTTAALIDVENHEKIRTEDDEGSCPYQKIHKFLKEVMAANPEADDIYTFRKTEKERVWAFIVGGYEERDKNSDGIIEEGEEPVGIGEEFSPYDYPPEILEAFSHPIAEHDINCDKWGCWLSGYAPIRNEGGAAVAVAAVDIPADNILAFEKKAKEVILFSLIVFTVLFPAVTYLILRILVRPVSVIVSGLEEFTRNLSKRINVSSGDEFELIASTFNKMAGELESLYSSLEEKVSQKTKELSDRVREIEQKNAEDEALLASIGEAMIAFDWNGRMVVANAQAERMLGLKRKDFLGKEYKEFTSLTDEKGVPVGEKKNPISQVLRGEKKAATSAFYFKRKDGLRFPVNITASPVVLKQKTVGAIAVFRDITREKEVDKAKSEFVSLASHQLLTPLSSISWYAEMLLEKGSGEDKKKRRRYLEKIYGANRRMVELVSSLLNVSRIEMGTFSIEVEPVDIREIILSLLDELKPELMASGIKVEKKFENVPSGFGADPRLLRIIIQNLLSNAVKYTPPGGKIKVRAGTEKGRGKNPVFVEIADSGYGIPVADQPKMFTKLFRADNIKEKVTEGTGLGLYIVKSIVDNSGGEISFSSRENKGTTFRINFPLAGMKGKIGTRRLR